MPRGKILKESPSLQSNENKVTPEESNDSNTAVKFTLVEPESEQNDAEAHVESPMHLLEKDNPNTLNFKFTLLLVALFVAVNIGLVALLDESKPNNSPQVTKDETATVKQPENTAGAQEKPELPSATTADDTKPALGKTVEQDKPAEVKPSADVTSSGNAPAEKPVSVVQPVAQSAEPQGDAPVVKQEVQQPSANQDLLSIISKD